ncbi:unnamed protein product [Tilletia controversa]|uniref:Uncharacterized protein n=1 Tax=Tilletia controversa TaxID=13291 RepID=A0A8X7MZX3_9BASI|nr:hypothetical protein CF328_g2143 [Tilletia controversa]KAE8255078.1 hypothetical protein A4X06_0g604 [Tilletia controversa]CAD6933195.1 unnamed protein product [Tilletia controversa]CAD6964620.1 unnamed protein product [Tilletia controversa]CAD6968588.1 unnamed protein product [Tilletia controversa]
MKTLFHMIKDRAAKSSNAHSHYGTDDDSNPSSSTSSHTSDASFRAARRSRSNTQPTKQKKECFSSHPLPLPKGPAANGFIVPHPSQSTPSLAIPRSSPQLPNLPGKFRNNQNADKRQGRDEGRSNTVTSHTEQVNELCPPASPSLAQFPGNREPASAANTIRPCRSFRDSPLGSLLVLKDRLAVSSSSFLHPDDSIDPTSDDVHGEAGMGSAFSDMTVVSGVDHASALRYISSKRSMDTSAKDAVSTSSGSASSIHNTRRSIEDTISQYRRLQAETPTPPPRAPSRSRARTVLQRLRRPLTAGSRRPEEPFDLAAMKPHGFGFNQTAAPITGNPNLSGEDGFSSGVTPRLNAGHPSSLEFDSSVRGVPSDVSSPNSATFTTSLHRPSNVSDEISPMELSILVNELTGPETNPEDVSAQASRIIRWAEHIAAREISHGTVVGGSRSLGPQGLGILSSSLLRSIDYLEMMVQGHLSKGEHSVGECRNILAAFHHAKDLCTPIATPNTPLASELPSGTFHTGLAVAMVPNRRHGSISAELSSEPLPPPGALPLTPPNILNLFDPHHKGSPAQRFTDLHGGATAPLSPTSMNSTPNPAATTEMNLATLVTPPEPRKLIDNVSPFESQLAETSGKGATVSLTPAPRRRKRPTTAPETSGNGGLHAFGAALSLTAAAAREGLGTVMDKSPRLPSPRIPDGGRETQNRSASNTEPLASAVGSPPNRRTMLHQPSFSYPGRDADAENELDGGQLELLRSNSPFDPAYTYQHHHSSPSHHALSQQDRNGGEMMGRGGAGRRIGGPNQSRPNTATSVLTVTGSRSGTNTPQEIFTPESFRAGPRPSSRSTSSNNSTPYLRSDASVSQRSLAKSGAATPLTPPSFGGVAALGAPIVLTNGSSSGLGIRLGESGDFAQHADHPSIRSKQSQSSISDIDPQFNGRQAPESVAGLRFGGANPNELRAFTAGKVFRMAPGFRKASMGATSTTTAAAV